MAYVNEAEPRHNGADYGPSGGVLMDAEPARSLRFDFEDFFENGAMPLHLVGADGTILHANRAELELLGYPEDEYIGRRIMDFHVDPPVIADILARLRRGEKLVKYPSRLRARDGSIKDVEITSSVQFRDGSFANTRCFTVDVTELRRAQAALQRREDELRQILEALPAAVYTTDAGGKITYYNQAAVAMAGRNPEIGKDEWCVTFRLFTSDGTPLPHNQCPMAVALKENRPVRGVEAMAQRPDGTMFPFLPFPTPIRDREGKLVGAVNMLVDLTDRKEAETHQKVLLQELNHRVKNNLQMLHGLLRAAQRESRSLEAAGVLADVGRRVAAMAAAQQLLYRDSNQQGFGVGEFLAAVCESAAQSFDKKVTFDLRSDAGFLSNDVSMPLALILNELLTNAVKHGVRQGDAGRMLVSLKQEKRKGASTEMVLVVEDNGPGFELRPTDRRSSGLGLVTGLVRQLRGTFAVQPGDTGRGARCVVRFEARRPGLE